MNFTSTESRDFVLYFCSKLSQNHQGMILEDQDELFQSYAPIVLPLLDALPVGYTSADILNDSIDLRHSSAVTLFLMAKRELGLKGNTDVVKRSSFLKALILE